MFVLFHDYASAASAVAVRRLQRLADDGVAVRFTGFEPVPVDLTLPVTVDVIAELERVADEAAAEGVVLSRPSRLPATGRAHLVGDLAEHAGLGASWRDVAYAALWSDDADLSDPDVLLELASAAGLDAASVSARLRQPGAVAAHRRSMAAHRREGVGGVPTLLTQSTLVPGLLPEADLRALARLA